jgi:hypothetical protein
MRLSELLRNEADHKLLVGDKFIDTRAMLVQAADLLDVYYIQGKAAVTSERLSEAKMNVYHALREDV